MKIGEILMKKILIRSGIAPNEIRKPEEMILNNLIGGNVGNLIYAYSIYRNLMTEDVEIIPDKYKIEPNQADYINENYDAYIIPLADAFRDTFIKHLKKYTELFKKLKIPVVIVGVGIKAPIGKNVNEGFPFDKEVKEFIAAVLEKSNIVGVRGQTTADYLSYLGFKEGKDHMVIGCPSMYTFGRNLKIRDLHFNENSIISLNSSKLTPEKGLKFISQIAEDYENYYFIPQWMSEFKMVYLGNEKLGENTLYYPNTISYKFYREGKVRYPLNAHMWIKFLKNVDLSVGARLHGNITATLSGTPSLLLAKDARMSELADYHNLTQLKIDEIDENTKLQDVIPKLDFKSPEKVHERNFDRFIYFLNKNNLDHIYNYKYEEVPFDKVMKNTKLPNMLEPINNLTPPQISERFINYEKLKGKKNEIAKKNTEKKLTKLTNNNRKKQKEINYLKKTLNRKSVKMSIKLTDVLRKIKK